MDEKVEKLVNEILYLNPKAGTLGEGKANQLQELAREIQIEMQKSFNVGDKL